MGLKESFLVNGKVLKLSGSTLKCPILSLGVAMDTESLRATCQEEKNRSGTVLAAAWWVAPRAESQI